MADKKISALTSASTPLAGTEVLPIVQSGTTVKVAVSDLTAGRSVSMSQIDAGNIRAVTNTISSTNTNGALNLLPNGTGKLFLNTSTNTFGRSTIIGGETHVRLSANNNLEIITPNVGVGARLFARNDAGILNRLELQGATVTMIMASGANGTTFDNTSGDFTAHIGNIVIGTSGKGINTSSAIPVTFNINNVEAARIHASGGVSIGNTTDPGATNLSVTGTVRTGGYTVATLPAAGVIGRRAYVTDATLPTYLGALIGGGAVVCPVFDNGTAWVSA
jgi:hypothetical protein